MALPDAANIVLLASNYNPSIISKEWLSQKGIFTEPAENFLHTPILALIENKDFAFAVDEQRLQLIIKRVTDENLAKAAQMVCKFAQTLPETPYKGLGLNYSYSNEKGCDLNVLFTPKSATLKKLFSSDFQMGTMLVFPFESFLVSLSISPRQSKEEKMTLAFNFHTSVSNAKEVIKEISLQPATLDKTKTIVLGLCKND